MRNLTVTLDEDVLKAARDYARRHNVSLNSLIRRLLAQQVTPGGKDGLEECFSLMHKARGNSRGRTWKRGDLYDV